MFAQPGKHLGSGHTSSSNTGYAVRDVEVHQLRVGTLTSLGETSLEDSLQSPANTPRKGMVHTGNSLPLSSSEIDIRRKNRGANVPRKSNDSYTSQLPSKRKLAKTQYIIKPNNKLYRTGPIFNLEDGPCDALGDSSLQSIPFLEKCADQYIIDQEWHLNEDELPNKGVTLRQGTEPKFPPREPRIISDFTSGSKLEPHHLPKQYQPSQLQLTTEAIVASGKALWDSYFKSKVMKLTNSVKNGEDKPVWKKKSEQALEEFEKLAKEGKLKSKSAKRPPKIDFSWPVNDEKGKEKECKWACNCPSNGIVCSTVRKRLRDKTCPKANTLPDNIMCAYDIYNKIYYNQEECLANDIRNLKKPFTFMAPDNGVYYYYNKPITTTSKQTDKPRNQKKQDLIEKAIMNDIQQELAAADALAEIDQMNLDDKKELQLVVQALENNDVPKEPEGDHYDLNPFAAPVEFIAKDCEGKVLWLPGIRTIFPTICVSLMSFINYSIYKWTLDLSRFLPSFIYDRTTPKIRTVVMISCVVAGIVQLYHLLNQHPEKFMNPYVKTYRVTPSNNNVILDLDQDVRTDTQMKCELKHKTIKVRNYRIIQSYGPRDDTTRMITGPISRAMEWLGYHNEKHYVASDELLSQVCGPDVFIGDIPRKLYNNRVKSKLMSQSTINFDRSLITQNHYIVDETKYIANMHYFKMRQKKIFNDPLVEPHFQESPTPVGED